MNNLDILYGYGLSAQQAQLQNGLHQQAMNQQNIAMQTYGGYQGINNDQPAPEKDCVADYLKERAAKLKDKPKGKGVFSQISNDVKSFIIEHRSVIYFVAAAILIDHFLFKGAFRERLQSVADRLVKRVEDKVAEVTK